MKKEITLGREKMFLVKKQYGKTNQILLETVDKNSDTIYTLTANLKDHDIPDGFVAIKDYGETKGLVHELVRLKIVYPAKSTIRLNDTDIIHVCEMIWESEPKMLKNNVLYEPELASLKSLVEDYVKERQANGYVHDDFEHYIFEEVLELFYGKDIFKKLK